MVHVGECRERNHTGKDDSEGERAEGERGKRGTNHARLIPTF